MSPAPDDFSVSPTPPASPQSLAPVPSRAVELLPDPVLPTLSRPLTLSGPHTYAAIWPYVRREGQSAAVARELALVRDDGVLCLSSQPFGAGHPTDFSIEDQPAPTDDGQLSTAHVLLLSDTSLPLSHAPLPLDRFWSDRGLHSYLAGRRPDPAELFGRLVALLSHFMDFSSLSGTGQESVAELLAVYILATWFAPALPVLGFLWLVGDHGSGKSRLLYLLTRLTHLGLLLHTLAATPGLAALCGLGAATAIDDALFLSAARAGRSRGVGPASRALLLSGRQRGALVPIFRRAHAGAARSALVDVSGPRLFACTHPPDPAIAANCIVLPLLRTADDAHVTRDPADPAAWPANVVLRDVVDDLWAVSLSRLGELPSHVRLSAQSTAELRQSGHYSWVGSLAGHAFQPWHSLLAVASWLTAQGVTGLLGRLSHYAENYSADRPAFETTDLTALVVLALFECANAHLLKLRSVPPLRDAIGGSVRHDSSDSSVRRDSSDSSIRRDSSDSSIRRDSSDSSVRRDSSDRGDRGDRGDGESEMDTPSFFPFTASQVLLAVQQAAGGRTAIPASRLTASVVGQLLSHLGLAYYRTNQLRMWSLTPAHLTRLARAYGVSMPYELAAALS
jgi:hypothetical protein